MTGGLRRRTRIGQSSLRRLRARTTPSVQPSRPAALSGRITIQSRHRRRLRRTFHLARPRLDRRHDLRLPRPLGQEDRSRGSHVRPFEDAQFALLQRQLHAAPLAPTGCRSDQTDHGPTTLRTVVHAQQALGARTQRAHQPAVGHRYRRRLHPSKRIPRLLRGSFTSTPNQSPNYISIALNISFASKSP